MSTIIENWDTIVLMATNILAIFSPQLKLKDK